MSENFSFLAGQSVTDGKHGRFDAIMYAKLAKNITDMELNGG